LAEVRIVDARNRTDAQGILSTFDSKWEGHTRKQPQNHDLDGWYRLAIVYGLPDEPAIAANIELLNLLQIDHYTRYPQDRSTPVPEASTIADSTVDHLISQITQRLNPR
jgi:hypothetical protein